MNLYLISANCFQKRKGILFIMSACQSLPMDLKYILS